MKNITKTMLVLISTIIISFSSFANRTHIYVTAEFAPTTWYYYCITQYDTVILHKPTDATGQIIWGGPSTLFTDSVTVTLTNQGDWSFDSDNISKVINIYFSTAAPVATLASDTTICGSGAFNLVLNAQNTTNYCTYAWPGTTTTTQTRVVTTPGIYWLNVTNACGSITDSIHVYQKSNTLPNLGPDTNLCNGNTIILHGSTGYDSYLWSNGTTGQNLSVTTAGTYWLQVTNTCINTKRDSVIVGSFTTPTPNLGADRNICQGNTVTLNPGTYQRYLWYNGQTTPTVTVGAGTYWMEAWNGSCRALSNTIHITAVAPTPQNICYVEFDVPTLNNAVYWPTTMPGNTDSVVIYYESATDTWTKIGTKSAEIGVFIDINSAPQNQSYSYKIATIDSCGNESIKSTNHTTITLLSAYDQPSNTYGFTWSAYTGITVPSYILYGIKAGGIVDSIGSVPGNQHMYNYVNPNPVYIKYYIGFQAPSCGGAKSNHIVKSNWIEKDPLINGITEMGEIPFSIYPNPAKALVNVNINLKNFHVEIRNIVGQVLLSQNDTKSIDISSLAAGSYVISVIADGIKTNKMFIKE